MIPYMVGKFASISTRFTRKVVKYISRRGYFCAGSPQNGHKITTPPPRSLNDSAGHSLLRRCSSSLSRAQRLWDATRARPFTISPGEGEGGRPARVAVARRHLPASLIRATEMKSVRIVAAALQLVIGGIVKPFSPVIIFA